jgi:hypothetical protein
MNDIKEPQLNIINIQLLSCAQSTDPLLGPGSSKPSSNRPNTQPARIHPIHMQCCVALLTLHLKKTNSSLSVLFSSGLVQLKSE